MLSLYARADKALYVAKLAGRDRVQAEQPSMDGSAALG